MNTPNCQNIKKNLHKEYLKRFFSKPQKSEFETSETEELGCKLAAELILGDGLRRIVIPSKDEWIGLHLLDRDGELKRKKNT